MFKQQLAGLLTLLCIYSTVIIAAEIDHDNTRGAITKIQSELTLKTNLGVDLTETEIEKYSITIFPDGANLPLGKGSVLQGKELYNNRCKMCHGKNGDEGPAARLTGSDGWFSISDPLRILRIKQYPILLISVASLWPHAPTIFDYVRRAMPHYAPKSLTNNEVYALTAYILYMNDFVDKNTILDKHTILEVTMPGYNRSVSAW